MFGHVGAKNYDIYFDVARRCLRDEEATGGGLFLLHCIGSNVSVRHTDPWIGRYIFPNSMLPSAAQIAACTEGRFVTEDWHNFGTDYDLTLQAWRAIFLPWFRSEEHTSELQSLMRISYAVFCLKKKKNTTKRIICSDTQD